MKKTIDLRGLRIGEGTPKICVPIIANKGADILTEIKLAKDSGADMIEWRADYFENIDNIDKTVDYSKLIRRCFPHLPILFTYRTEDGLHKLDKKKYWELNQAILDGGAVDLIDIEYSLGFGLCQKFCDFTKNLSANVVVSSHNFGATPTLDEILRLLLEMQETGASIVKYACMPKSSENLLTLLLATDVFVKEYAKVPLITMSMGELGKVSRVSGEVFGSSVTFGTTGAASAPGQIDVSKLRDILDALHCK